MKQSRALVADVLAAQGFVVTDVRTWDSRFNVYRRIVARRRPAATLNVFLEKLYPHVFPLAPRQALIPNQEWFFARDLPLLARVDLVICKTRHAERIFSELGARTAFSSFTSYDRRTPGAPMRPAFLYLGANQLAIARRLLTLWARHPEWPLLTITASRGLPPAAVPNVRLLRRVLADAEIVRLQNEHRFHLCVTRAEGFGHKLNEGMSCGAIVIAVDGAPMNELVTPERGMLVRAAASEPLGLGTAYAFDEDDLERTIECCVRLPDAERDRLAAGARAWFEANDRVFRAALPEIVRTLV
jgi:hypothetical protein